MKYEEGNGIGMSRISNTANEQCREPDEVVRSKCKLQKGESFNFGMKYKEDTEVGASRIVHTASEQLQ